ncbi:hypothetical protein ACFW04_011793 [Cataglyphis niger]
MNKIEEKGSKNLIQRCMSLIIITYDNYRMCDLKCIRILKGILRAKAVDECDFETVIRMANEVPRNARGVKMPPTVN